jgi:hypothetical protein
MIINIALAGFFAIAVSCAHLLLKNITAKEKQKIIQARKLYSKTID